MYPLPPSVHKALANTGDTLTHKKDYSMFKVVTIIEEESKQKSATKEEKPRNVWRLKCFYVMQFTGQNWNPRRNKKRFWNKANENIPLWIPGV